MAVSHQVATNVRDGGMTQPPSNLGEAIRLQRTVAAADRGVAERGGEAACLGEVRRSRLTGVNHCPERVRVPRCCRLSRGRKNEDRFASPG